MLQTDARQEEVGASRAGIESSIELFHELDPALDANERDLPSAGVVRIPLKTSARIKPGVIDRIHDTSVGALDPDPF